MANALASKSMHELDKRTTDHFYDSSPGTLNFTHLPEKSFSKTFFYSRHVTFDTKFTN
jgi:hypothetical protein